MDLQSLGRVPKGIHYVPGRVPGNLGLLETDDLVLKQYSTRPIHKKLGLRFVQEARRFLQEQISSREIDSGIGFGFSVLSYAVAPNYGAYLNVCVWGKEFPTFLMNRLFLFGKGKPYKIPESATIAGGFPIWTLGIVEHERKAWKKYLESRIIEEGPEEHKELIFATQRSEDAKREYLESYRWEHL